MHFDYSMHKGQSIQVISVNEKSLLEESCQGFIVRQYQVILPKKNLTSDFLHTCILVLSVATVPSFTLPDSIIYSRKLFSFSLSWLPFDPEVSLANINPVPNKPWFLRVCSTML